jgi:hypothetical protein
MCDHRSEPPLWSGGRGCQCHDDGHAEVRDRAAADGGRQGESEGEILGLDTTGLTRFGTQYYWVTTGFHFVYKRQYWLLTGF